MIKPFLLFAGVLAALSLNSAFAQSAPPEVLTFRL